MNQKPTQGRIVIYVANEKALEGPPYPLPERTFPAIVVGYEDDTVDLCVFFPEPASRTKIDHDEGGRPGTWHWPPRES